MRALQLSILSAFGVLSSVIGFAQDGPAVLAEVRVFSDRIANQASAGAFAMPVSALRFEPQVDVQTRNLGEAQADLTIRGGTFESVGVKLGGISLSDPQTGHYLAEIPVALEMLATSKIVTGAALALDGTNATSGAVAYTWRPITKGGLAHMTIGDGQLFSSTWYQSLVAPARFGQTRLHDHAQTLDRPRRQTLSLPSHWRLPSRSCQSHAGA
jgi:outer membrane receptor protein involved in Fe transport